tara:strand:+ start:44 stop:1285 length:1242 start_codon:yes stop_codon:yes gene_type:complete
MILLINIYYILFGIITVINRGGAGLEIGNINIVILLIFITPLLYFGLKNNLPINLDFPVLLFIFISFLILVQHLLSISFSTEIIRTSGILLYPVSLLAGISLARPKTVKRTKDVIRIILFLSVIYGFLYPIKNFLKDLFIINDISLLGFYGSYYTITVAAFCFFYSGFGSKSNKKGLSIASAFSTLIHPSRNGILGLISAFFINIISRRKILLSKKSFLEISISLIFIFIAILIVFPFLSRIGTDVRGNYDITFFFEALKSIFVAGSNDDSLSGSVDHRLIMLFLTLGQLFTNIQYFFLGIPLDINYTEAVFNDPHNGYVSIFARGGIFNLLSFIFLQYQLIRKILLCRAKLGPNNFSSFSLSFSISSLIMIFFTTMLTSPMNAIPYYFLLGFIWQINNYYLNDYAEKNKSIS